MHACTPVVGLVLRPDQEPHEEEVDDHIGRQRAIGHVHVGRQRSDQVGQHCAQGSSGKFLLMPRMHQTKA